MAEAGRFTPGVRFIAIVLFVSPFSDKGERDYDEALLTLSLTLTP